MGWEVFSGRDGSGGVFSWLSDSIAGLGSILVVKLDVGADGTSTPLSSTSPLPSRDPAKGNALGKGGGTSTASTQQLAASNTSRTLIEVSNGGTSGVWLAFGSSAVAGQGTYLPAKATGFWPTTAAVNYILEASGTGGPVGYTEWGT